MKWETLLETVAGKAIFSTAQLLPSNEPARQVYLQLWHWVKDGRLVQLRRGLYTLNPSKWEGLIDLAQRIGSPKLIRAAQLVEPLYEDELNAESIDNLGQPFCLVEKPYPVIFRLAELLIV